MIEKSNNKPYDLEEKTFQFAESLILETIEPKKIFSEIIVNPM